LSKLIYSAIASLDGYIEDHDGNFNWGVPVDEAHAFINNLMRPIGTHLYGRRMYEVMMAWETDSSLGEQSPTMADFARLWQAAEKVVYSQTLKSVSTARTRIARTFEAESIRQMKQELEADLVIGGPELAANAFKAGLIDECYVFLAPITVGRGKPAFPQAIHVHLGLLDQRRFTDGMVYLHYKFEERIPI
jgi:dihydrofolate reductase